MHECPICKYTEKYAEFNDEVCLSPCRFYTVGVELVQQTNKHSDYWPRRSALFGCPQCGNVFIEV